MSDLASESQPPTPRHLLSDDLAYILPMAIFLGFTWAEGHWPGFYALGYILKTIATGIALVLLWPRYTKIRWNGAWLGFLLGVVSTIQWIAMQLWLERHFQFFRSSSEPFNPLNYFHSRQLLIGFIAFRIFDASVVVPFMEERFWRDYLWRQIIAPNDFKLASIGEWSLPAFILVSLIFSTVHGYWWLTAVVWAALIGLLLVKTKSLAACIVCHATTNLLLGLYVLKYHAWGFW